MTRDLSTSRDSTSNTAHPASLASPQTTSAAFSGNGPLERAQASEYGALVWSEQLVAPFDRGEQGLLSGEHRAGPTRQEQEALVELLGDLLWGHRATASGGQLQGEGDAIHAAADLTHRVGIQIGEREARTCPLGAVCEQAHGVEHRQLDDIQPVARTGDRQGRHPPRDLARHPERLATGGQDREPRTGGEQAVGEVRDGVDDVLAVVQNDQDRTVSYEPGDGIDGRLGGGLPHPQHARHRGRHRTRVVHRGQLHEGHPVRIAVDALGGRVHRQSRLADSRRTGQRDEPMGLAARAMASSSLARPMNGVAWSGRL